MSFNAASFSLVFKILFLIIETAFFVILIVFVPIGAHSTVVFISIANMIAVAWFWYNSVRSVDITSDRGLQFFIGNFEVDVPFDKIVSIRQIDIWSPVSFVSLPFAPHRGYLSDPADGVAIVTSMPSTPFWAWPRSAGRPERRCCGCGCPRLVIVFSPAGGADSFIVEVEKEMANNKNRKHQQKSGNAGGVNPTLGNQQQPPILWVDQNNPTGVIGDGGNGSGPGMRSNGGKQPVDLFDV